MAALNRNGVRIPLIGGICLLPDRNALNDLAVQTDHEIAADGNSVTAALIFQPLKIIMVLLCRRPRICHIVNHDPVDDRDIRPRSGISVDREKLLINPVWHLDRGRIDQLADHFPAQRPACSRTQEENKQTQKQPKNIAEEGYYASMLCLLGHQALEEERTLYFPDEYKIDYLNHQSVKTPEAI